MASSPYFRISLDADGYRGRFYGANGELVWWTEGYTTRAAAEHAIRMLQVYASNAPVY